MAEKKRWGALVLRYQSFCKLGQFVTFLRPKTPYKTPLQRLVFLHPSPSRAGKLGELIELAAASGAGAVFIGLAVLLGSSIFSVKRN